MERNYRYTTERLLVDEWHAIEAADWPNLNLTDFIQNTMTERVTKALPPSWQGPYTNERANEWIHERDDEGITLLAINQELKVPVGLIILFDVENTGSLRLGYILNESAWGQGFATELITGLMDWCQRNEIHSITGGVEQDNIASKKVLEKCGFLIEQDTIELGEQLYSRQFT